ncbi:HlyD family efflux transporter periplasmic adaptor subunit [Chitiniphilus purpureus]|uniref:HlyD family efflux transporter periplasmic adaptor subunit n=1 Tax=Chitiniphilus purpureus TaxID=2981137 RepID=A0ABY6DLR5_9NEIS|nr:HlyD family efflux transporter periplasmic adaptor subunit [Chitiniphilus sp. CD1]UXY15307.1 HlyD family efflux transporter periplasmic adaptor subunit [Chitiniphilus sp. CD1]
MPLPPLRQELSLHPGPVDPYGAPTWTLHDPAANRFYQLSWPAFEILSRWHRGDAAQVLAAVNAETTLQVGADDLEDLYRLLAGHHLLVGHDAAYTGRLAESAAAQRMSKTMWLLKHYLFFRVPLLRPMPLLKRLAPRLEWAFTPACWYALAAIAVFGLYLASRRWDEFTHTFSAYAGPEGLLGIGIALSFAKVLHEFGHALTAYRCGCRVPTMGVAFLVMWPVLYTDTNEAWKLRRRGERLRIGAAGMLSELALAALATLAWSFLPDGPLRSAAFLLATSTWLLTLAINASPFMRFDGYFLLSDWLEMPNLHERAFALARWRLREALFGLGEAPPESFTPGRQRFLLAFAFATWLYRLVLFFGIALMVYHLFFKALGLLLMVIELGWFIVLPIWRELRVWWSRRAALRWHRQTLRTAAVLALLALLVLVPWQGTVRAPAVLTAVRNQSLYAAQAGRIVGDAAREGQRVRAGERLATLVSPELEFRLRMAQAQEQALRWQVEQQPFATELQEAGDVLRRRWAGAREAVHGLIAQRRQLEVRAPFDGTVVETNAFLAPGAWLARGEKLFQIVGAEGGLKVEAFVGERDHALLDRSQGGRFIADLPEAGTLRCSRAEPDEVNMTVLPQPYLASSHGGRLPVVRNDRQELVPLQTTFRVRLTQCGHAAVAGELPGVAILVRERHSLAQSAWTALLDLLQRERGL